MLKNFNEMRKVDVLPYCEKREGMLYLKRLYPDWNKEMLVYHK